MPTMFPTCFSSPTLPTKRVHAAEEYLYAAFWTALPKRRLGWLLLPRDIVSFHQ